MLVHMSSGLPGVHSLRPPRSGTEQGSVARPQRARQDVRAELRRGSAHRHLDREIGRRYFKVNAWSLSGGGERLRARLGWESRGRGVFF